MISSYQPDTGRVRITRGDGSFIETIPFATGPHERRPDYRHPIAFFERDTSRPWSKNGVYVKRAMREFPTP